MTRLEEDRRARERRLRAWALHGQPEKPRRPERIAPREAEVLAAHRGGDLVLGDRP
ncbi:MAG TPA: hypothetical protein VK586_15830 [Streptosporangiaceae bacterium]|nr:hypothetical protein [Streptosporangiaceae bacterium]